MTFTLIPATLSTQRAARDDLRTLLAPATDDELRAILSALEGGRINGTWYCGPCACLIGTVANHRWAVLHPDAPEVPTDPSDESEKHYRELCGITEAQFGADGARPVERFTIALRPGHTSANDPRAALLHEWVSELIAERRA